MIEEVQGRERTMVSVREFDMSKDAGAVLEMEMRCELRPEGKRKEGLSLVFDQMGDPMCRIRHTMDHVMLVAEYEEDKKIIGVVRACTKVVTRGRDAQNETTLLSKVAYILGLRVSPAHRRLGIGTELVTAAEAWSRRRGAEYAYMATEPTNAASLGLFTGRLGYTRHRSLSILARPVHAHRLPVSRGAAILRLPPPVAAALYRRIFLPSSEFFPAADIAALLSHPLSLATFVSLPAGHSPQALTKGDGPLPEELAVVSVWNSARVFRVRVAGPRAPRVRAILAAARAVDERAPWLRVPSVRDVTRPVGVYVMYGVHARGSRGAALLRGLCHLAHNMALEDEECAALVAEVGRDDTVAAAGIPHWKSFSCQEDIWCMKHLVSHNIIKNNNWVTAHLTTNLIFVDPREF